MAGPVQFNFDKAFNDAQATVADREAQVNEVLWGHLAKRAAEDESFRQQLSSKPEETAAAEAQKLNLALAPAQIQKAKEIFGESRALRGIDQSKVEGLIFGTISDVRKSFNTTLELSKWLFYVGLALLIAAAVFVATKQGQEAAQAGWLFGAGGIISLVVSLVMNPLDRIRNAGANLVQIQMAYLAYYNLLYLLGTRVENLPFEEAKKYAEEFRTTAESMVKAVQSVLDKNAAPPQIGDGKPSQPAAAPAVATPPVTPPAATPAVAPPAVAPPVAP
jgi:uncharacterized membrane protein (DUF485 family)